jgi:hypothetical protein
MAFMFAAMHLGNGVEPMIIAFERTRDEDGFTALARERALMLGGDLKRRGYDMPAGCRVAICMAIGEDADMERLREALYPIFGPRMDEKVTLQ